MGIEEIEPHAKSIENIVNKVIAEKFPTFRGKSYMWGLKHQRPGAKKKSYHGLERWLSG